jgi:hypothetical protein
VQKQIDDALQGAARVGFAGTGALFDSAVSLASAEDISEQMADLVRAIPPATALRGHAETVARALIAARTALVAGASELDLASATAAELVRGGSILQIIHASVDRFDAQRPTGRRVAPDSIVTLFAESAPASGGWVEAGVAVVLDEADSVALDMREALNLSLRAGAAAASPGRTLGDVAVAMWQPLRGVGEPTIGMGHSTGWDQGSLVVRIGSTEPIRAGDALCLHPSVRVADGRSAGVATTVLVGADTTEDLIPAAVRDAIPTSARA